MDVSERATAAVHALDSGLDVGDVPAHPDWNHEFIGAVRAFKDQFRGSKDLERSLRILGELLYGKDVHWALELLQNAEDAGARRVAFIFSPEQVVVINDGAPFSPADVWGICSAGHSSKKNKVGFFGIGFKAVYKLTDLPQVHSGPYSFEIEGKIYPRPIDRIRARWTGARFLLPVKDGERSRLSSMLRQLASPEFMHVLLTLRTVREIRIIDRLGTNRSGRFRADSAPSDDGSADVTLWTSWQEIAAERWRRYEFTSAPLEVDLPREGRNFEAGETTQLVLARRIDGVESNPRLHCFLPLDVRSELRWLVQADFEPTPGRERLRQGAWNRWLMGQVGLALAKAVTAEARRGVVPWNLIPLDNEVVDDDQRLAFKAAMEALRSSRFVRTARGFKCPPEVAWELYPLIRPAVRESDLAGVGQPALSYVSQSVLGIVPTDADSRAEVVLRALGSTAITCDHIVAVMSQSDRVFYSSPRDADWWRAALLAMARHASEEQRLRFAATRCLPVRSNRRVGPPPEADNRAYLVTYSRSDNLDDLQRFFGQSRIHLIDRFLQPELQSGRVKQDLVEIQEFLEAAPFHVAGEARPYHVINHLVLPRMKATPRDRHLSAIEREELWRLTEYLRNKWPSYVSEYRSRKNIRATEESVANELAEQVCVVSEVSTAGRVEIFARAPNELFVPSSFLGHSGMDEALAGMPGLAVVHQIHKNQLTAKARRGGRRAGPVPDVVAFLVRLGAQRGPRIQARHVSAYAGDYVAPSQFPWVDWSDVPAEFHDRTNVLGDTDSEDVRWFADQWPRWGERRRRQRAAAIITAIAADWSRLSPATRGRAAYFWFSWRDAGSVLSSWMGRLSMLPIVRSPAGTWERPTSLVLDTPVNRRAALGDLSRTLGSALDADVARGLGVRDRPTPDELLDALTELRESGVGDDVALTEAAACYQLLAETLASAPDDREALASAWRPRFQGNSAKGLVFAPVQGEVDRKWWPLSRVVRSDVAAVVGPYVGSLGTRYRRAAELWDALHVPAGLTGDLIADVIRRDLVGDSNQLRAAEFYGRIAAYLQLNGLAEPEVDELPPALTTQGWVPGAEAAWTADQVVTEALSVAAALWTPGDRDPSTLDRAAKWLGVQPIDHESLTVDLLAGRQDPPELEQLARWQDALSLWPSLLRSEGFLDDTEVYELQSRIAAVRPAIAPHFQVRLSYRRGRNATELDVQPGAYLAGDQLVVDSSEALFSPRAAHALAGLVRSGRLHAANTLSALLGHARHAPDELQRLRLRYSVSEIRFDEHHYELLDEPEEPVEPTTEPERSRSRRHRRPNAPDQPKLVELPPASTYVVASVEVIPGEVSDSTTEHRKKKLRPPSSKKHQEEEPTTDPVPTVRLNNMQVEQRAGRFVEQYERQRGCSVTRQGPLVGADFLASDGRYIEVKSFSGAAGDAFDLEAPEWQAAQRPGVGENYFVYVVEHVADGQNPRLMVLPNPMASETVRKEPTGKLRVSRWTTLTRHVVEFARDEPASPPTS